ncbi:hypothetical protein ACJ41O_010460 [Fusarium nematophilum]
MAATALQEEEDTPSIAQTSDETLSDLRQISIRCRLLLHKLSTPPDSPTDGAEAREQMASFNIWASNMGVFREGRQSLSSRLKSAPEISELAQQLLLTLERDLEKQVLRRDQPEQDKASSDTESEDSSDRSSTSSYRLLQPTEDDEAPTAPQSSAWTSIQNTITSLRQLALTVHRAGAHHRQARIERFKNLDRNKEVYETVERYALQKVDHLFPDASETLRKRMAQSIATRRARFSYLETHQKKVSTLSEPAPVLQPKESVIDEMPQVASPAGQPQARNTAAPQPWYLEANMDPSVVLSNTVVTKLDPRRMQALPPKRAESVLSIQIGTGTFPSIPKLDSTGTSFTCPYCFLVCPAKEVSSQTQWKNHLIHDFEPFFCVFDDSLEKHVRDHLVSVALILAPVETGEADQELDDTKSEAQRDQNSERDIEEVGVSHPIHCTKAICDCSDKNKDSVSKWSTFEATLAPWGDALGHGVPMPCDDPSFEVNLDALEEWNFWHPLSLPPDCEPTGPPEYQGLASDTKLHEYFNIEGQAPAPLVRKVAPGKHPLIPKLRALGNREAKPESRRSKEFADILDWLTAGISRALYQNDECLSQATPDTGYWLLQSDKFQQWVQEKGTYLFCPGIPGAGKTVMTAMVVHELAARFQNDESIAIASVFCSSNSDLQGLTLVDDLLVHILLQLAQRLSFFFVRAFLNAVLEEVTVEDLRSRLRDAAETACDSLYSGIIHDVQELSGHKKDSVLRILTWLTLTTEPLTAVQLEYVLVAHSDPGLEVLSVQSVLDLCHGLIQETESSPHIFRFCHATARSYFQRNRQQWLPDGQMNIARLCLECLSVGACGTGPCLTDEEFDQRLDQYPLYSYAARNWGHHARHAPSLQLDVLRFLQNKAFVESSIQALFVSEPRGEKGLSQIFPRQMTALHLAALFGIVNAMDALPRINPDIDAQDTFGRTPLFYAAMNGHEDAIRWLMTNKSDPNVKDKDGKTPLSEAWDKGHEAVLEILQEFNVDDFQLGHSWLHDLVDDGNWSRAAEVCERVLRSSKEWAYWVTKFLTNHQLDEIVDYVPPYGSVQPRLAYGIYDDILSYYWTRDKAQFEELWRNAEDLAVMKEEHGDCDEKTWEDEDVNEPALLSEEQTLAWANWENVEVWKAMDSKKMPILLRNREAWKIVYNCLYPGEDHPEMQVAEE